MSLDLALWKSAANAEDSEYRTYVRICDGDVEAVTQSPDVLACRDEILRSQPSWIDATEPRMGRAEQLDRYVLLTLPFSWANDETMAMVETSAAAHGLVLFDPQTYDGPTDDDDEDDDWNS